MASDTARRLNLRGNAQFKRQEWERAIDAYSRALAIEPTNTTYLLNRCNARLRFGELDLALQDVEQAVSHNPDAYAYNLRGNVWLSLRQPDEAIASYSLAISLDPNFSRAFSNRGRTYYEANNIDSAIADYNQAIRLDPTNPGAYNDRGYAYLDLHQLEQAIQDFDKAIEFKPDYTLAYYNRALAYLRLNQLDSAIQDFQRSIDGDRGNGRGSLGLGMARARINASRPQAIEDLCRSVQFLSEDLERNPHEAWSWLFRAQARRYLALLTPAGSTTGLQLRDGGESHTRAELLAQATLDLEQVLVLNQLSTALIERGLVRISASDIVLGRQDLAAAFAMRPQRTPLLAGIDRHLPCQSISHSLSKSMRYCRQERRHPRAGSDAANTRSN